MIRPLLLAVAVWPACWATCEPATARPAHPRHGASVTDPDRTLARMADRDRREPWPAWEEERPLASRFSPATREQVAAPPFTGWGYGATIPDAWPGFR